LDQRNILPLRVSKKRKRTWRAYRPEEIRLRALHFVGQVEVVHRRQIKLHKRPAIQDFFFTASGFGTIVLDARTIRIRMLEGELLLEKLVLADGAQSKTLEWKSTVRPDAPAIKPV